MSNPSPGFKKKAGGQNFKKIFVNICAVCKARCTHPIIAIEVFRRRPPRFAERFLGQLCGSSLPKVCGIAATLFVYNGAFAPWRSFLLEVLQTVKGCTAQEPPAADDIVNIIIHNIHAGGICKDFLEQDTHF